MPMEEQNRQITLLVTAFEPFGGETRNASLDAVARLPAQCGAVRIVRQTVPTAFGTSVKTVIEAIQREQPDAVLMVGQAGSRGILTPERQAVNRIRARIPDNAGVQPAEQPVVPGGSPCMQATLPVEEITRAIRDAGVPAAVSEDAGAFVCNQLLYGVLHDLSNRERPIPAGFLHVPRSEEQTEGRQPALPLAQIVAGLTAAVGAVAAHLTEEHREERKQ